VGKNKFYAVTVGRTIGIFDNWKECSASIEGFSGALHKSFNTFEEAEMYINGEKGDVTQEAGTKNSTQYDYLVEDNSVNVFTDGSYNEDLNFTSYGYVMFTNESNLKLYSAAMYDKYGSRNVTGEIEGVKEAINTAIYYKYNKIKIFHDYSGIKYWADDTWKANSAVAIQYKDFIMDSKKKIEIIFQHVKGHSGNKYNEIADSLAGNELKSLIPDIESEWGYKSYKYNDKTLKDLLKKIKNDFDDFSYTIENKDNHDVIKCSLLKEKVTMIKYKFDHGNKLLMQRVDDSQLFSLIYSYLQDVGRIETLIQTFNANNKTSYTNEEVQTKLYEIAPSLKGKRLDTHIYRLLLSATYEVMRVAEYIDDASYIIVPAMRALEGHLKVLFDLELDIKIAKNSFGYFDEDALGNKTLQVAHSNKTTPDIASHIEKCYNFYYNVRNVFLHFGDIDLGDTRYMNLQDSKDKIDQAIKIIGDYYLI